jgi:sugar (pentulose or hexulose) kinase
VDDLLLGIDVGTQGVKAALVTPSGRVMASAYKEHDSYYPRPDWVEQDMTQNWWLDPLAVIRQVTEEAGCANHIRSIGSAAFILPWGQRMGMVFHSLMILYSDNRSVAGVKEVNPVRNLRL